MKKVKRPIFPRAQKVLDIFGENVKLARLRRKFSTKQVSERAGIGESTLLKIEKGDESVSMGNYFRVLFVLGLQDDFLLVAKDDDWLKFDDHQLDPELQLYSGDQYLATNKHNFGLFMDSSPDRWGKMLMLRREAVIARSESRKPNKLYGNDFLLGVHDKNRMGALRFKTDTENDFLNNSQDLATPPLDKP